MSVSTTRSSIGHFARIPRHIASAKVSERSKAVWRELAFLSSPEKPIVWVCQRHLADLLGVCTKTIQRAVKELVQNGLLKWVGWHEGRHKRYLMAWKNFLLQGGQNCPTTLDTNVQRPKTKLSNDLGQICPNINKGQEQRTNTIISTLAPTEKDVEAVLEDHGEEFKKRFPAIDGSKGRPSLKSCIEQALNHTARHKYENLRVYLEMWLQNASNKWHNQYIKDAGVYAETEEERYKRLNWDQIRRARQLEDAKKFFANA